MQITKPEKATIYVTALDRRNRRSKSFTVYGAQSPEQVIERCQRAIQDEREKRRSRHRVPA